MTTVTGRWRRTRPSRDHEGRMTLAEHLRELRSRLGRSVLAVVVAGTVGLVFYNQILQLFVGPFLDTVRRLEAEQGLDAVVNFDGIADPFTVPLKLALLTGIVLAAPVWIYQVWAFVTPGLYRNERRWAAAVMVTAVPLFLAGIALCYWLLPKGLTVILGFTPDGVSNFVSFSRYFNFVVRLLLVFGVAFLLPVFVVLLNAVGVFAGQTLANTRRWIVFGIFVFAAVATPTGDPITMLALAIPMWALFETSVIICKLNDRRRERALAAAGFDVADDEASVIEEAPSDLDHEPSSAVDAPVGTSREDETTRDIT